LNILLPGTFPAFASRTKLRVIKFLLVGGLCTLLQYLLFFQTVGLLSSSVWWEVTCINACAFTISTQANYILSLHFTWSDRRNKDLDRIIDRAALTKFNLMAVISLIANTSVFAVCVPIFGHLISLALGTVAGLILTYTISHRIVFAVKSTNKIKRIGSQATSSEG